MPCSVEAGIERNYTWSMAPQPVLLSFVGNRDPYVENEEDFGTALHKGFGEGCRFTFVSLHLDSPIYYEEIFAKLRLTIAAITRGLAGTRHELFVLLNPGIPARFAGGSYKAWEVNLDSQVLPVVRVREQEPAARAVKWRPEAEQRAEAAPTWIALKQCDRIVGQSPGFLRAVEQAQ